MKKEQTKKDINSRKQDRQDARQDRPAKSKATIALAISTAVLGVTTLGLGIGYAITQSQANYFSTQLEGSYKSNFYSLVDSVNNLENKISKTLSATSSTYQRKTLLEAAQNASEAEIAVASLPFSQNDIEETIKLVNQVSGYTTTLAENLVENDLTAEQTATLEEIHSSVIALQNQLNEFARKLGQGYSIIDASMNINTNGNEFSRTLSSFKDLSVDYPTMIYDGPFSDSVVQSEVKGLSGEQISKAQAYENLQKYFKTAASVDYEGQSDGRFQTFNFRVTNSGGNMLYAQVSQIGGNILTISGAGADGSSSIDFASAKEIALKFASDNGIEGAEVVWSDTINQDVYFNIAPTQNGIILYPDLVKVKVNMVDGSVVGYDATPYFTNHVSRTLAKPSLSLTDGVGRVPSDFEIISSRVVLSPLDYNREVVCIEVQAEKEGQTYYFYINASTGEMENVLKVIKTDNGNLLM